MFETLRQHPLLALNQAARDLLDTLAALQDDFHSRIESTNTIGYMADPECAWRYRSASGVIVVDDIDVNPAFDTFTRAHPEDPSFVCTAEPLRRDTGRFNQKGLFAIICKQSPQDADP